MQAGDTCSAYRAETLTQMEQEAAELEARLKGVQASAAALRASILAEEIAGGCTYLPVPPHNPAIPRSAFSLTQKEETKKDDKTTLPKVILAELPMQHILRLKWKLVSNPPATATASDPNATYDIAVREDFAQEGHLRLFGLLENGEPWECSIVYSNLMNDGGITIGRDADKADVVLFHESVSRCHARLELTNRGLVVTDENSTNGTRINDIKLSNYDKQATLNDGDLLNLAGISLFVELI